jgi:hypothetical protein
MLAHSANAVVEARITYEHEDRPSDKYLNRLRYRATAPNDSSSYAQWASALTSVFEDRFNLVWDDGVFVSKLAFQLIFPFDDAPEEAGYSQAFSPMVGLTSYTGLGGSADPAMCAVVTRKSTRPGRRRIGHVFWGPLAVDFDTAGYLDPAPATVVDDLQPVVDCLGDPLVVLGVNYKPVVLPNEILECNANDDVVNQFWAPRVVQRHTRRPGIGA